MVLTDRHTGLPLCWFFPCSAEYKYIDRVAGEDLGIDLEGSNYHEATLVFFGDAVNFTLVQNGNPVGNDLPDYSGRVRVSSSRITISNVNTSDVGKYRLFDRKDRLVSVTKMKLIGKFSLNL